MKTSPLHFITTFIVSSIKSIALPLAAACLFTAAPINDASAQNGPTPPPPEKRASNLKQLQGSLKVAKESKKKSEALLIDIEKDLLASKTKFIALGKRIQANERETADLDQSIREAQVKFKKLQLNIEADREAMADALITLDRVSKVPAIALAARPGAPLENAQGALVIQSMTKELQKRASDMQDNSIKLESLMAQLSKQKQSLADKSDRLRADRAKMSLYMKRKKNLQARSRGDIKKAQARIKKIEAQSRNLQDLFSQVETHKQAAKKPARKRSLFKRGKSSKGKFNLPILGSIKVAYGQKDHLDAPSKGLWINGTKGGLVTAPAAGKVSFVGKFKSYGNIVILDHGNHYHSLIAGFEQITAAIDSKVDSGEPIGYQKNGAENSAPPLIYFELRKSGKVINPKNKISNL